MGIENWFTEDRILEIRRLNDLGYNDANIADMMGGDFLRVHRFRKLDGMPGNSRYTGMSGEKKGRTARKSLEKNTGELMNYRNAAHVFYATEIGWPGFKLGEALILYVLQRGEGMLEAKEIVRRMNHKKAERGWKPATNMARFYHLVSSLKSQGLVDRDNPRGKEWRTKPRSYYLTDLAYERMRGVGDGLADD